MSKKFDVICLGRAAVDLYGDQVGSLLEDVSSFQKTLGGSSGNIAYGAAKQGLKTAMLTRVGDEPMGRFVKKSLSSAGCDTTHVVTDKDKLTGLVFLSIKDKNTFPLLFYRQDCADMNMQLADVDPDFIKSSKSLLITGTHFSTPSIFAVSLKAMKAAKAEGTKIIVDIDYRPVLWGVTNLENGESRFIPSQDVSSHLQSILPYCDLLVGTEEEIHIAGGTTNTLDALKRIRQLTSAEIVMKMGSLGCYIFDANIPDTLDDAFQFQGVSVDVLNVLGAGDAFLSGFLRGWLFNESYQRCCEYANACGALVVSRHSCAPAIPSKEELDYYLENQKEIPRPNVDVPLKKYHRIATRLPAADKELAILAVDHRTQLHDLAMAMGCGDGEIKKAKQLVIKALIALKEPLPTGLSSGVLIDDTYGLDLLNQLTGTDMWMARPVEVPKSRPLELEGGRSVGSKLISWPKSHIVKCLVSYCIDDAIDLRNAQERQIMELYQACCESGHAFLLEVLPAKYSDDELAIVRIMQRFYHLGVDPDWWKIPPQSATCWMNIDRVIAKCSIGCQGVIILGIDKPIHVLAKAFQDSAASTYCKGFAVGRSIFRKPCESWFNQEISDLVFMKQIQRNYLQLVGAWEARAMDESLYA